jgi:competence protein ComEC
MTSEDSGPFHRAWVHLTASGRSLMHTQWLMTVSLAPLTLVFFGQVSVVGWVANLVAIPLVTLLITPLALAGVVWQALWWPAAALVDGLMVLLQTLGAWPWARLTWPALTGGLAMAAVLGGLALVWRWPWSLRAMGLAVLLPVLLWRPERPAVGEFEVLAADVGQGSGVLIRTASTSLMYDSGPQWGPQSDAGQRVLLPLWQALGETPSQVVLSHRDGDHVGGALAVLQALAGAKANDTSAVSVWASFAPRDMVSALSDPALARQLLAQPPRWTRCEAGQHWALDGVRFEVLHPIPALYGREPPTRSNNLSCVLWVRGVHTSALLTGDLEADQEAVLVQTHPELQVDWLLAPHHGSRTSSSERLLDAVRPRWVVVQAGFLSRYGHPAPQVLARYRERGIRWVATPACGAARWRSDRPESVQCQRAQSRRYWQEPPDAVPPPASLEQSSEPPMEGME